MGRIRRLALTLAISPIVFVVFAVVTLALPVAGYLIAWACGVSTVYGVVGGFAAFVVFMDVVLPLRRRRAGTDSDLESNQPH